MHKPELLLGRGVLYTGDQVRPLSEESERQTQPLDERVSMCSVVVAARPEEVALSQSEGWMIPSPLKFARSRGTSGDLIQVTPWSGPAGETSQNASQTPCPLGRVTSTDPPDAQSPFASTFDETLRDISTRALK